MEDQSSPPTSSLPGQRSAEMLRQLHDRAHQALASQRARVGSLEEQLSARLDDLHQSILDQLNEAEAGREESLELEALRSHLAEAQQSWDEEREEQESSLRDREQLLRQREAELLEQSNNLCSRDEEILQKEKERQARKDDLSKRERNLEERAAQIDGQEKLQNQRSIDIEVRENELKQGKDELNARHQELERGQQEVAERETAVGQSEQRLQQRERQLQEKEQELETRREEIELRQSQLSSATGSHHQEVKSLRQERDSLQEKFDKLEAESTTLREEFQQKQADWKGNCAQLEQAFLEKEDRWRSELAALQCERDKLVEAVNATATRLEEMRRAESDRDELQQKFDLALEDVQRMRERVSGLEQELARRPEPDQRDSAELLHLRAERDALSERVATLESQVSQVSESNGAGESQEAADLQRRFELAVEDVRQLKSENAQLKEDIAALQNTVVSDAGDGQDWEAQKRRLLESLEGEGAQGSSYEERASIEDTIRITDEVVATKDREITALRAQLEAIDTQSEIAATDNAEETARVEELLDADEIVQQHRERLQQLEEELQEKLRTAEVQLSLERAKIAREQSELAEWRIELESLRESIDTSQPTGSAPPKRRWLAKLGLSGDDDE